MLQGTIPFISFEILSGFQYIQRQGRIFYHDAVHDMESFFWVLLYFALTRRSGNHMERKDKDAINAILSSVFSSERATSRESKEDLFYDPGEVANCIALVDPYFDSLKPFLGRWFKLINVAITYRGYEYNQIHKHVIKILEEAIKALPDNTEDAKHANDQIQARRKEHMRACTAFDTPESGDVSTKRSATESHPDEAALPPLKKGRGGAEGQKRGSDLKL